MPKPFDEAMKRLARFNPQALIKWFLPGALFIKELPLDLNLTEFDVDVLLLVDWEGQEMLLHIEFQTRNDYEMAHRTLRYNVLAHCEYKKPVMSIVIYLFQDGTIPISPVEWYLPTGQRVLDFHYASFKLWEMSVDDLLGLDHVGLLPLIPLTHDGARRAPVDAMLDRLNGSGDADFLFFGYTLATLVFKKLNPGELDWLKRSYAHMQERLEESPFYQFILEKGLEKGLEEGRERGLEEGRERGLEEGRGEGVRESLLNIVDVKYAQSDVPALARGFIGQTTNRDVLLDLLIQISLASTTDDVRTTLLAWARSNGFQS